jgi:hypothetical protein
MTTAMKIRVVRMMRARGRRGENQARMRTAWRKGRNKRSSDGCGGG